ncbi:MAG: TIGR02391 family protein [Actinomycetota bacterium]|nr:TIGR02391 family protein [Actinomycetota bacterium]
MGTARKPPAGAGEQMLRELAKEITDPVSEYQSVAAWHRRAFAALNRLMGSDSIWSREFDELADDLVLPDPSLVESWDLHNFKERFRRATGVLMAAAEDLQSIGTISNTTPNPDEAGIDPELWEHISSEIRTEAWGKVASQAVIFTEDRIRKWAGRPVGEVGKDLAVAIFGKSGQFQMGKTDGEMQGWQLFAQGIAQALRNVDAHRIQNRPDHKRYALGLVGACSLLLTQMRYAHSNRFRDTTPATSDDHQD